MFLSQLENAVKYLAISQNIYEKDSFFFVLSCKFNFSRPATRRRNKVYRSRPTLFTNISSSVSPKQLACAEKCSVQHSSSVAAKVRHLRRGSLADASSRDVGSSTVVARRAYHQHTSSVSSCHHHTFPPLTFRSDFVSRTAQAMRQIIVTVSFTYH